MRWQTLALTGTVMMLFLTSCGGPPSGPTPTPTLEELPPPVTPLVPFELSPAVAPTAERPPSLYLDPPTVSLPVGQNTTVRIWAEGVQKVTSLSLQVRLEPGSVAQIVDSDPAGAGVQVAPGDLFPVSLANQVEGNLVNFQAMRDPGESLPSGGVVASITLQGIAPGMASLQFIHVGAQDAEGNPVKMALPASGIVSVTGPGTPGAPPPTQLPPQGIQPTPAPLPTVAVRPTPAPTGRGIYYVVQPGENLFRIGLRFGTTAEAIAAASGIPDPQRVQAGAMVLIPVPSGCAGYGYYVQPGDTLYSISRRFGMTVEELASLNGIGPDYNIRVGQILCVVRR